MQAIEQKHWIQRYLFLVLTTIVVVTFFLVGLALHELNIVTPFDGFYMWLHSLFGEEPMAVGDGWHWRGPLAVPDSWRWS
jgi:hypothetical protein